MSAPQNFRSAFNGFNREDVVRYLEYINTKHTTQVNQLNSEIDYLRARVETMQPDPALAEQSFMSEVYFRKLFKSSYGISPQKYIIRLRIQHAKGLISIGYYSLKEIALMSGYTDYKYFSTEFKKQVGVSPSDYIYNYNK